MIYFVQAIDGGPIKIGTTGRLSTRLKQLGIEFGKDLRLLAVMDGSFEEEKSLHKRFAHLRIAPSALNERFEPDASLLGFIRANGRTWGGEDEVPSGAQPTLFAVKGTASWHEWLKQYVDSQGIGIMAAIDNALREAAKRDEFTKPMPKRSAK